MDYSTEMRVIIRACVTDIPGEPRGRYTALGNMFCIQFLGRPLNARPNPSCYGGVYMLDGFDSDKPVKRWFIYDINVKCPYTQEKLPLNVTHKVFLASKQTDSDTLYAIKCRLRSSR
jgi:hypothetical protein